MKRRLMNRGETRLHEEIRDAAHGFGADIFRKVRIADVVDIDQLSRRELRSYGLMAHFDVLVATPEGLPAFAIEYDGGGHDPSKDALKNTIAREANLALFRVDETLLDRNRGGMTFLQYLIHIWFMGCEFQAMQVRGEISPEEPFMMRSFIKADAKSIFDTEYDFTHAALGRIGGILIRSGEAKPPLTMAMMGARFLVLGRDDSSFVGYANVSFRGRPHYGRAKIDIGTPCLGELIELPFGWSALSDYCEGMAFEDLADCLEISASGGDHALLSLDTIRREVAALKARGYRMLRAMGDGGEHELSSFI